MEDCCTRYCDRPEYHVPPNFSRKELFMLLVSNDSDICSLQTFYKLLNEEFPYLKFSNETPEILENSENS